MDDPYSPIDFSGIVGYPHDISEDVIDNIPDYDDYDDASDHVRAFTQCIDEWCDPPIYEDVLMQLFVMTLGVESYYWCHDSPDKRFKTIRDLLHAFLEMFGHDRDKVYDELVEDFMEKWRRKNLLNIKTTNSYIEVDSPPDPSKDLREIIVNMQLAPAKQFEALNEQITAMEARLAEEETYMDYSDPLELELHSVKDEEVYWEILDEPMDEPIIHFEEIKELEFENVEYLDDSSPHPPPEEPIFLKGNFENLEENNMMAPVVCSFSTSQPEDELMQNYVEMESNFSLMMTSHYEYWLASHLDSHEQQSIQSLHGLSYSSVWLKEGRNMKSGWFFRTSSKLIKPWKGSSVSHLGQGCFRHLWLHSIQCMDGCNVSLTLLLYFNFVFFHLLCHYVLRCISVS
jgi:hypothetical protein